MTSLYREITPYEREKWFDELKRFEFGDAPSPHFLSYGDELGEAFDGALYCADKTDYGLSDAFVEHAQIQVLDMYYDQILLYTGDYGGMYEPEDLGLPPREVFVNKAKIMGIEKLASFDQIRTDDERRLWDWAMQWREEHIEEFQRNRRAEQLRAELERLERDSATA